MTPAAALIELLHRVGARNGLAAVIGDEELSEWPNTAVAMMRMRGLLRKAPPATSAGCNGCEQQCVMPVQVVRDSVRGPAAFIICDKRSDISRVPVPLGRLEQWQATGDSIAELLAALLGLRRPGASSGNAARWEIGTLKGTRYSSHVVLAADGVLTLALAGHSVPLVDVLMLDGDTPKVDRRILIHAVDHPATGGGDRESAECRQERLRKRAETLKASGIRAFLKTLAEEEGISTSRAKQILARNHPGKSKISR